MRYYEFHVYDATRDGYVSLEARVERMICSDNRAAKSVGRALAKTGTGPVDIALAEGPVVLPWDARYIATAVRHDLSSARVTVERL